MSGIDAERMRSAFAELPDGTSYGEAPGLGNVYFPQSHLKALHPDMPVVTGMRGAGKTFWWSALQNGAVCQLRGPARDVGALGPDGSAPGCGRQGPPRSALPGVVRSRRGPRWCVQRYASRRWSTRMTTMPSSSFRKIARRLPARSRNRPRHRPPRACTSPAPVAAKRSTASRIRRRSGGGRASTSFAARRVYRTVIVQGATGGRQRRRLDRVRGRVPPLRSPPPHGP